MNFKKKNLFLPIIFYLKKSINTTITPVVYKLWSIKSLFNKYKIFKKFYHILFYSDLMLIDYNFLIDLQKNKKKILKYLEMNKKNFLFFYYNKKIYNYKFLIILVKFYDFLYSNFFYFLKIKKINFNFLKILIYIKNKNANN